MSTICQIALLAGGAFLLFLTYKMYGRGWKTPTWVCALLGVIAILGTQGWVQGFIKTHILSLGYEYGEQLGKFHSTVERIENTVNKHQARLDQQQKELALQQVAVTNMLGRLLVQSATLTEQQRRQEDQHVQLAGANKQLTETAKRLSDQQERLSSVEILVNNIYTRTRIDKIQGSESNRVCYAVRGSNAVFGVFLLKEVPIANSIQGYFGNNPLKPGIQAFKNAAVTVLVGKQSDWDNQEFNFSYVADPTQSNVYSRVEVREGAAFIDGLKLPLPRE